MKKNTIALVAGLLFLAVGRLGAQALKLKIDPQVKYPAPSVLPADKRDQLIKTVETLLNEYATAATLLDAGKKRVTGESVKRYQDLFIPTAEVVQDYLENIPETAISFKDYASTVFNQFSQQGLQMRITGITLTEVVNDASGYFIPVVKVEKTFYNYLNAKGEIKINASGRLLPQEFRFDVSKENLGKARISKIKRLCKDKECDEKADYVKYAGLSFGAGWGIVNESKVGTWEQVHADSKLDVSRDIGLSLGYELLSNRISPRNSTTKNLFFSIGARASFHLMQAELSDFSLPLFGATTEPAQNGGLTGAYQRSASNIAVSEKVNIGLIEVPIGLGFRLKSTLKSAWFAQLRLIPGFTVFGSANGSGTGDYIASLPDCNWTSSSPTAYNTLDPDFGIFDAGLRDIENKPDPKKGGFALALQFSPTGYFDLSDDDPTNTLAVGLDLTFNLRSFIGHEANSTDLFQYSKQYDRPIVQQYLSGMSVFSAGLRIGLSRKTSTRP